MMYIQPEDKRLKFGLVTLQEADASNGIPNRLAIHHLLIYLFTSSPSTNFDDESLQSLGIHVHDLSNDHVIMGLLAFKMHFNATFRFCSNVAFFYCLMTLIHAFQWVWNFFFLIFPTLILKNV